MVFDLPDSLLGDVAARLGLNAYAGYYHIDGILFSEEDRIPEVPIGQTWIRRLRVAFEHEHDFYSGLYSEVGHLLILDADLKVLVSYPNSPDDLKDGLSYLHRVILGSDRHALISSDQSFLFIAGYLNDAEKTVNWTGHVFGKSSWIQLP